MADPITNAQFALGLFAPVAQGLQNIGSSRLNMAIRNDDIARSEALRAAESQRKDALAYWNRKMDREDADTERKFREAQGDKQIGVTLAAQDEQTKRIVAQMEATDKRQRQAEVRRLYDEYSELTRDEAKALTEFGKDELEQFESLSKEVGKLKQKVLLSNQMARLVEDYGKLGGKKNLDEFGNTPQEQIQGLSKEIGTLNVERRRKQYVSINRQLGNLDAKIADAEKLTPEEEEQAKISGIRAMSNDARTAFLQYTQGKAKVSEEDALAKIQRAFPQDIAEYRAQMNQTRAGLRMNKRENDKTIAALYRSRQMFDMALAKAGSDLVDDDPEALLTPTQPVPAPTAAIPTALRRVSVGDVAAPGQTVNPDGIGRALGGIISSMGMGAGVPPSPLAGAIAPPPRPLVNAPTLAGQIMARNGTTDPSILRSLFPGAYANQQPVQRVLSEYDRAMLPSYTPERTGPEVRYALAQPSFGEGWLYPKQPGTQ